MREIIEKCGGYAIIDGGFATELERHGADLKDPLWSAKCLITSPHLVRRATIQGFEAKGLSREEGEALLRRSVKLALEARDIYYERCTKDFSDFIRDQTYSKRPILIAASVGSYGAYLADGSEYRGDYGDAVTVETLKDFHRDRIKILADSGADLIAFETIPNLLEAKVTSKPVLVYPNSGETYIAESSRWVKSSGVDEEDFVSHIGKWRDAGASIFGGCCRTTPNTIRGITQAICQKPL
ncbi:hypothetical protein TanjilG_04648 [Lupinus angustifolius]|uniref:Hcy-binding domain-containing protein n=1 Tax=Lupinus angustifolius TaxID=3871 RepID=A0A4P1RK77_LUPAN|nr:hypothetical protein TanjilG_04648 [Lupinus angustifolius]